MKPFLQFASGGAVALILLTGCEKQPKAAQPDYSKTTPNVAETERPGNEMASDVNPVTARLRVSDLKVGKALGTDGAVAENLDEVRPGDPVHASIAVGDVGAGSRIKAVWLGPDERRISEDVKDVAVGTTYLVFHAPDTGAWPGGDYKVEIYLGDELAASESFDIVPAA